MTTGREDPVRTAGACVTTRSPVAATATPTMTLARTNFLRLISVIRERIRGEGWGARSLRPLPL